VAVKSKEEIAAEIIECCLMWEPAARVLGNVTTMELAALARLAVDRRDHGRHAPQQARPRRAGDHVSGPLEAEQAPTDGLEPLLVKVDRLGAPRGPVLTVDPCKPS
jgi:hypothetical protein